MEYVYRAWGARHEIDVKKAGKGCLVTANGVQAKVLLRRVSDRRSVLVVDGRSREVLTVTDGRVTYIIVDGKTFCLEPDGPGGVEVRATEERFSPGDYPLRSPMPGRVAEVRTVVGDHVEKGATLVVLEAMKMENVIAVPTDAEIIDVLVAPGDLVEGGAVLMKFRVGG